MKIARNVAEVVRQHVPLEVACIDWLYLNVYVRAVPTPGGAVWLFREIRGKPVPSSSLMARITRAFIQAIEALVKREAVDLIAFNSGERKNGRTQEYFRKWPGNEGVLYVVIDRILSFFGIKCTGAVVF